MLKVVKTIEEANCITHSGTFHADEVFASAFLELYLGDVSIYRTNNVDLSKVKENTLIYDVGRGKYDHHQNDALKRDNGITYCSFGLLWKEFGKDFLQKRGISLVDRAWEMLDKDFVEGIDADDNGVFPQIIAPFKVKMIPGIIKTFNPSFQTNQCENNS